MAKHPLYVPTRGWDMSILPPPLNTLPSKTMDYSCFSEFHPAGKQSVLMNAYVTKAVFEYMRGTTSDIAVVEIGDQAYATEFSLESGETALFVLYPNGQCKGAIRSSAGRHSPLPSLAKTEQLSLSFIFLPVLIQLSDRYSDVKARLDDALSMFAAGPVSPDLEAQTYFYFSDALEGALSKGVAKAVMTGGNVELLTAQVVDVGALNGKVICGEPKVLSQRKSSAPTGTMQFSDAMTEFSDWRKRRTWSEAERALIPTFPDDFPVMPETLKICRRYVGTHEDKRPMLNFLWRGVTSYGKSTGVELMAALLNMPLLRVTCHTTMETQDFLSSIVPVSKTEQNKELPSFEEIAFDPESAYLAMTGKEKAGATSEECLAVYGETCAAKASQGNGSLFKQVESNFVRALEHGYLLEVQECSRIKDPGVLVGLNEFDRPGALIPLVDGTFVRRHEDAMVVYTDNVGYASCRSVDPSVLRRMAFIIDSNTIPKDVALSRVVYNTGFEAHALLEEMYDIWEKIREFCADRDITEGSISLSELERWAQCVMADGYGNVFENCRECVVSKATSVPEEQEDIVSSVLAVHLS